jgi:hypothetical protein
MVRAREGGNDVVGDVRYVIAVVTDCVIMTVVKRKVFRTVHTVDIKSRIDGSLKPFLRYDTREVKQANVPISFSSIMSTIGLFCQSVSKFAAKSANLRRVSFITGQSSLFLESTAADIVLAYSLAKGAIFT